MKLLLLTSYVCLSLAYSNTPTQYHIQTDDGPNRYFRYQTYNGQYRKEKRFEDGTVVGTYGWVDANNYLRLYNYIADKNGYRIISSKKMKVDPPRRIFRPAPIKPAVQPQRKRPNVNVVRANSIGDTGRRKSQSEFINSKLHPKLQPKYSEESEDSDEEYLETHHRQSSSEFINSKIHPKLRPLYSRSSQSKRKFNMEDSASVEETMIHQRRRPAPEFINSKMHVKLRPLYSRKNKIQSLDSKRSNNYNSRQRTVFRKIRKVTPEFINSKIHPKLQPNDSSNSEITSSQQDSFGGKRPTKQSQSLPSNERVQNSPSNQVGKSLTTPEEFRMDIPGGRITMDFDLGNQYRKEKIYPDGRIVGEHGYVDPLGILRKTFYKSGGPDGQKQESVSYWVGTRTPGS